MIGSDFEKQDLNQQILKKIQFRIFSYEHENHGTKKYSDPEMVTKIRKTIDDLVRSEDSI